MTQNHCQHVAPVVDSVGMGAYTMDSHHVQRYVTQEGWVKNEGDVQKGGFPPYTISYRSLVPRRGEAENLLVPFAWRQATLLLVRSWMEPVFMILGQSAATAASLAIDDGVSVQDVDYPALRQRLLADGQILELVQEK